MLPDPLNDATSKNLDKHSLKKIIYCFLVNCFNNQVSKNGTSFRICIEILHITKMLFLIRIVLKRQASTAIIQSLQ